MADEYEEKDVRKRKWFSLEEAQKMLCAFKPIQAKYLVALKQSKSQSSSDHESSQANLRSWNYYGCCYTTILKLD